MAVLHPVWAGSPQPFPFRTDLTCPCWLQLFRLLWLYSTLYGLAGLGTRADQYPFPESWRLALGRIAAASPLLVAGQSLDNSESLFSHVLWLDSLLAGVWAGERPSSGLACGAWLDCSGLPFSGGWWVCTELLLLSGG